MTNDECGMTNWPGRAGDREDSMRDSIVPCGTWAGGVRLGFKFQVSGSKMADTELGRVPLVLEKWRSEQACGGGFPDLKLGT